MSSGFVSAEIKCETILGKEVCTNTDTGVKVEIDNSISSQASQKEKVNIDNPPSTPTPSHGFAGSAYEWAFGKGTTAEKGTLISKGEGVEKTFTAEGVGFSVSGILQGAGWALTVYGVVRMIDG